MSARLLPRHLLLLVVISLVLSGYFGFLENFFLYHPHYGLEITPARYGAPYEDVEFRAADGVRLHGWYTPPVRADGPVLLWSHGNAGNISHRSENIAWLRRETGMGVFIYDYRGYGRSEGKPSEAGLYADARAAYAWLRERVEPGRIVFFGRSLGAAVAVRIAAEGAQARGLILESPFESLAALGEKIFPFLPVRWMLRQEYDNVKWLPRAKLPVLILHGDADEIVPLSQGRRVFELASPPKRFHLIRGAGHNNTYLVGGPAYWAAWREFLAAPEKAP
ncbi:MAG: alpha/beta hydrolase [Nitrospinota bacterium]